MIEVRVPHLPQKTKNEMKEELKKSVYSASKKVLGEKGAKMYSMGYADGCVEGICVTAEELIKAVEDIPMIPSSIIIEHLSKIIENYKPQRIKFYNGNKERL